MALTHPQSAQGLNSGLNLFSVPSTDTSLLQGARWVEYSPIVPKVDPIEFTIPKGTSFIDLSKTQLFITLKITKADGSNIDDGKVGLINNPLHSIIKQFSIRLNGTLITEQSDTYAYRAYIESLLNYDKSAKETFLTSALFYKDTAKLMDEPDPSKAGVTRNLGLFARSQYTLLSNTVGLIGTPFCDIFHTERFLVPGVEMKIKLNLHQNEFILMSSAATEKVQIIESKLRIRHINVTPSVGLQLSNAIVKYPLRTVSTHLKTLTNGVLTESFNNIFNSGIVPERLIIGLIPNKAYNGDYSLNPFNFGHFALKNIKLTVNNAEIPETAIDLSDPGERIKGYNTLFAGDGTMHRGPGNDINRTEWDGGYGLFIYDLTPDGNGASPHFHIRQKGVVDLSLTFSKAVGSAGWDGGDKNIGALNVFIYAEYQKVLEITKDKTIVFDLVE